MSTPPAPDDSGGRPSLLGGRSAGQEPRNDAGPLSMLSSVEPARKAAPKARQRAAEPRPSRFGERAASGTNDLPASPGGISKWVIAALGLAVVAVGGTYVTFLQGQVQEPLVPGVASTGAGPVAQVASSGAAASIESMPKGVGDAAQPEGADSPFSRLDAMKPKATAVARAASTAAGKLLAPFAALDQPSKGKPESNPAVAAAGKGASVNAPAAAPKAALVAAPPTVATAAAPSPTAPVAVKESKSEPVATAPVPSLLAPPADQANMTPAQRRKAARDADVALLAAMIEHVSAHSREEVNGVMPPLRLPGAKARSMTTIAQIVEHCRTLEGEEAKVCKVKICENYWGKDDACSTKPDFHKPEAR